jgi:P-aminobenzoate N-oxygenase AurF
VTDESHHAYVAIELIKRIPGFSELPPLTASQPPFLRGLEELERGLPTGFADDLLVAFVSISETLITSILRGIPRDPRVVSAVRNTVRDHCIDEARHHSYFVYVVHQHWASSTPDQREILAPLYAKLIRLFLDPNIDLCRAWLLEAGLDPHDAEVVLQDYYSPERVAATVRADSFPTLKLMERVGILDHPTARLAFAKQKLID